ncbi:MAG: gliding motility-associated C-terminal domain-containing protein [Crocinitomicaceae bacterium]
MMIRLILLYLLVISSADAYCQLDTTHYLPPLFGRIDISQHYISISTLSNNNVNVDILRGDGTLIQNTTITNASPSLILLGAGSGSQGIIDSAGLNTINTTDGIIVKSSEPTFVNIRHVQTWQGLCLTSKGRFALGTAFRSGHLYSNQTYGYAKAHQISVMATEDNTVVNFLDFSPNVIFKNTPVTGNTSDPISVTLDRGESYVIAAFLDEPGATGNVTDVNGTKITSSNPIVVNSGSWLAGSTGSSRDIGVDQITPIEIIGTEYVFSEGTGATTNERPCVVAENNNTEVFLNGSAIPVATLNAGEYYFILSTAFSANGNMYVKTSKPAYVYQSLSGLNAASNGLNFIPPIRCDGNTEVIIPNVDLVGVASVSITARVGADVYVNGSGVPLGGAQGITGNPYWVTYEVAGGVGNFSVNSDSVINVALLTLSGTRGSAGYFSGFSALQEIERGDSLDFELCAHTASSFVRLNIDGPYTSITPVFKNPAHGGSLTIDSVLTDTVHFTYSNPSSLALIDSIELEVCKILSCTGTQVDTFCTVSNIAFNKFASTFAGYGDSLVICFDTSAIDLFSVLTGAPPSTGTWVDEDQSGYLFNGFFQTNVATPGIYHYSYIVDGPLTCYDSSIVTINVMPQNSLYCCPIDPIFTVQQINCNGANTGFIQIIDPSVAQFSIDGGLNYQTSGSFANLTAGTYNVTLEIVPGCTFDTIIILSEPPLLSATIQTDSVLCFNDCNGEILVTPSGGIGPYNFQVNGMAAQILPQFTGLCAGGHGITVTDANNCAFNQNVLIEEPQVLSLLVDSILDATCSASNGSIYLSAQGGTPGFSYSINGGVYQALPIFSGLLAGIYNLDVSDSNNCTTQINLNVNNLSGPLPTIDTLINLSCFGDSIGSAIIEVTGGLLPIQFSLNSSPYQFSNIFDSLLAGNYIVTARDGNGCDGQVNFSISEPSQLLVNLTHQDALCFDQCSAVAYLDVSGSNSPYNYSLNGSLFNPISFDQFDTITNICSGNNISVTVKDSLNCTVDTIINILEPDSIEIIPAVTNASCFYNCDGEILLQVIGGTGVFEFSIDNGATYQTSNQFTNLCGNSIYDLMVIDANLCLNSDTITLSAPQEFMVDTISVSHTTCGNSDGIIVVEIDNPGNPNYTFTNINTGIAVVNPSSATFSNLSSGTYGIVATDNLGCLDTMYVGINDNSLTITLDPASVTNIDCYGICTGFLSVNAAGGTLPYQFSINNGPLGNASTFGGLCAGQYVIMVQDASGCIETIQIDVIEPDQLSFSIANLDVNCFGDCSGEIAFVNNSGGNLPYSFSIDNGLTYFSDSIFTNLCPDQFDIILKDSNDCELISTQQITENTELIVTNVINDLSCNGFGDGEISFFPNGGVPNYEYSIDDGITFVTNPVQVGLNAGTYLVQIQDDLGCTVYDTLLVSEPLQNTMNIAKVENLCSYACTGELAITAAGGSMPYLYSIDNGLNWHTNSTFSNLCSGLYQVRVSDNNNCEVSLLDSLAYIDTLSFAATVLNSNCNLPTGSINVTAAGGTPNYLYSIDNINYNAVSFFNNLNIGIYDVSLMDANNCLVSEQFTINNFTSPQIDSIESVLPCHGDCNGSLTIFASGGTGAHEFSIDGLTFQNNDQFLGVCGGNYTVTVRDGNGCTNVLSYTLSEPDTISFSAIVNPLLCYGDQNGSINLIAQGGVGQLSYVINGGAPSSLPNFSQLGVGVYTIDIIDEIGCSVEFDTLLTQPSAIQIGFNSISPSCNGFCNGSLEAIVSGGIPNNGIYNYSWSPTNINSPLLNNICGGLYSIIVQDGNGCTADSLNFELTEPVFPALDSVSVTGVDCYGSTVGSNITAHAPAGNYFSFDGGVNFGLNNQLNNITPGSYWVQIQDVNNCQGDSLVVSVFTPQPLIGFINPDAIICPGELVHFSAIPTGGTAPYQFSWNNGYNTQVSFSENINADTIYYVEITDANGCSYMTGNREITLSLPPVMTTSNDTVVCPNQSVFLWAKPDNSSEDYTFKWNINEDTSDYFITPTINSDSIFYILVTDECNLTTLDSIHVDLFLQPQVDFELDTVYGCIPHVQEYKVNISQNTVAGNIQWNSSIGFISTGDNDGLTVIYDNPGLDNFTANYTSNNGCSYEIDIDTYISINSSPVVDFSFSPENPNNYDETISFKNESLEFSESNWSLGSQVFTSKNVDLGIKTIENIYKPFSACLEVSNESNCTDKICKLIEIESDQMIYVPNSFTPGGTDNSIFKADGTNVDIYGFHMVIFNRWGEIVFESYDINIGWDGTYAGNILSTAVFTWRIDVALESAPNESNTLVGNVTLLR